MTLRTRSILCPLLVFVFLACNDNPPAQTPPESPMPASVPRTTNDGTAKMIELLKEAYEGINPIQVPYFENSKRVEIIKRMIESNTLAMSPLSGQMLYGYELLKAGRSEDAVMHYENMLDKIIQANASNLQINTIKRLLAISYIRVGVETNCIVRYNPERCLMPLKGNALYEIKAATRTAIKLFEEVLASDPGNYESIWMLNFAYMTLGEFPDKVPEQWRLDEKAFQSDYRIPRFPNIAEKLGVNTFALAGGTCVDDFDNDGFLDLFASSWGFFDQIRFFKNNGDGTFSDRTAASGLTGITGGLNTIHADYNNDGFLDLLVLRGAWFEANGEIPNSLIRNNGDGSFTDVTVETGLLSYNPTQTAAWADFNNDGWIDLFIGNESWGADVQYPCELFMNNRDGTFTERIEVSGLRNVKALVKGVAAGDANNDGWPDLYLSFQGAENRLFLNKGLYFSDMISFGDSPAMKVLGKPNISFPCWFWDYNNDGWEDIFVAAYGLGITKEGNASTAEVAAKNHFGIQSGGNPRLYRNNGDDTFTDVTKQAGLMKGMFVMGANFGDIDNDGYPDCYLGTGAPAFSAIVPNKMFRNNKGKTFQDVTTAGGFGHIQKGHGVGFGDLDNDGDQDIFCVLGGAFEGDIFANAFFLNPMGNEKSWVTLKLEGTTSNRAAIGARVKTTAVNGAGKERIFYNTVSTGGSFGANSLQMETGLDDAVKIKSIEVRWPNRNRTVEVFENVEVKRFVKIKEGRGVVEYLDGRAFSFEL